MWLVPTSLLGGLDEEDSLPSSENQLWSADPDLNMNQMFREPDPEPEPDLESLSNPDNPPVPEPNPESEPSPELATKRDTEDTDKSDAIKQPSAFGLEPSDDSLDSRDPLFEPTKTDPLDDVLSPEPTMPDTGKVEDDIFGSPEGMFDSSDSFEVDDLNFDFEDSSYKPKSNGPLAIRAVNPVAKIPSYLEHSNSPPIAVTSGLYDEGIPLPPEGVIITSSDNVAPPPPNRAIQTNQRGSRPAAQRPLPLKITPSQTQTATPYQSRTSASARTPNANLRQQRPIGSSLTVTDLLMEAQPIEQQPPSKQMTMWLDDLSLIHI